MDYVVHVNNGSDAAKPIVLRLLPGEETIFNLRIVNHGDPSNITLNASDPVIKAVRLRKHDHYVVMEESVPILARMPTNDKRLDGEIILRGNSGTSRVPIYLLRDSEDPGIDLEDPGAKGDEDLKDDPDDQDRDSDDDENDYESDSDDSDEFVGKKRGREKEDDVDEDDSDDVDDSDDSDQIDQIRVPDEEKEVRRIVFSKDRDLQRYKSARRPHDIEVPGDEQRQSRNDGRDNYRIEESIDDNVQDQIDNRAKDQRTSSGYQDNYQDFRKDSFRQESFRQDSFRQVPSYGGGEIPVSSDSSEKDFEVAEEVDGLEDRRMGIMDNLGELGALKIIPVFIFVVLVLVLALTFITETLPEFPGALTSSILIVTLIIYGAATLLKA